MADLEAIIANSIKDLDRGDSGDDAGDVIDNTESTDSGVETVETEQAESTQRTEVDSSGTEISFENTEGATEGATEGEPVVETVEDAFAKEHGLTVKRPDGRENRIPYSRVKKIAENAEKKVFERVTGLTLAATDTIETALPKFTAQITERDEKIKTYESELGEVGRVEEIMVNNPEQFLQMLPSVNPKYAELLGGRRTEVAEKQEVVDADMPQPDLDLGNGHKTYSIDGMAKLRAWDRAQTRKEVLAEVGKELKPIRDAREARARVQAAIPRMEAIVDHAKKNYEGFTEHEQEIFDLMRADSEQAERTRRPQQIRSLDHAYILVMSKKHKDEVAKLKVDRETMRKEIIAEINKTPRSTSTVTGGVVRPTVTSSGDPITDAIRNSIKNIKR